MRGLVGAPRTSGILIILILVLECNGLLLARANLPIFWPLVDIEFEYSLLDHAVRKYHLAVAVLNPAIPFTLIDAAISPLHLAIAVALIIFVFTLVLVPACPSEHTEAVLLIVEVVPLILIAWLGTLCALPTALAMLQALALLFDTA
jgi:hypothetical protein